MAMLYEIEMSKKEDTKFELCRVLVFAYEFVSQDIRNEGNFRKTSQKTEKLIYIKL